MSVAHDAGGSLPPRVVHLGSPMIVSHDVPQTLSLKRHMEIYQTIRLQYLSHLFELRGRVYKSKKIFSYQTVGRHVKAFDRAISPHHNTKTWGFVVYIQGLLLRIECSSQQRLWESLEIRSIQPVKSSLFTSNCRQ